MTQNVRGRGVRVTDPLRQDFRAANAQIDISYDQNGNMTRIQKTLASGDVYYADVVYNQLNQLVRVSRWTTV